MTMGRRPTLAQMVGLHAAGLDQLVGRDRPFPPMPPDRNVFDVPQKEHPPLGFGPTVIAAGATCVITGQPQLVFKPHRLLVPSSLGNVFTIDDIRVMRNSQLTGSLPANMFGEDMPDLGIQFDTCPIGALIAISVTNITTRVATFNGCLLGAESARRPALNVAAIKKKDPIRYCDHCGAPPKRDHAPDACYYCQRKRQ